MVGLGLGRRRGGFGPARLPPAGRGVTPGRLRSLARPRRRLAVFLNRPSLSSMESVSELTDEVAAIGAQLFRVRFPFVGELRRYSWAKCQADLAAAATLSLVSIPQAIGFALILGLPPMPVITSVVVGRLRGLAVLLVAPPRLRPDQLDQHHRRLHAGEPRGQRPDAAPARRLSLPPDWHYSTDRRPVQFRRADQVHLPVRRHQLQRRHRDHPDRGPAPQRPGHGEHERRELPGMALARGGVRRHRARSTPGPSASPSSPWPSSRGCGACGRIGPRP